MWLHPRCADPRLRLSISHWHTRGHGHNFYIQVRFWSHSQPRQTILTSTLQNIRNNKTHARTPKWAQKWGLVDTSDIKRKERKSQWASRYNDRLPHSTLEGQPLEEGQEAGSSSVDLSAEGNRGFRQSSNGTSELWKSEDEIYYNQRDSTQPESGGRWKYPANFDDTELTAIPRKSKKKDKKDRWARTQEAYTLSEEQSKKKRKSSKRKKSKSSLQDSVISRDLSDAEFPEDAEGGLYGNSSRVVNDEDLTSLDGTNRKQLTATPGDIFDHQF